MWREGVGWKRHMGRMGLAENVRMGLKLLKKPAYDVWAFLKASNIGSQDMNYKLKLLSLISSNWKYKTYLLSAYKNYS